MLRCNTGSDSDPKTGQQPRDPGRGDMPGAGGGARPSFGPRTSADVEDPGRAFEGAALAALGLVVALALLLPSP